MVIQQLSFENFRNLKSQKLSPSSGINIIWGENGQGKTNVLEGMYIFPHLKSFRGAGNVDLIENGKEEAKLSLTVSTRNVNRHLEVKINRNGRNFLLDGKKPRPVEMILEALRAILFAPDELYPLRTLPFARRSLLDRGIFQLKPSYLQSALEYERILKQRNQLLREGLEDELIRPWTERLIVTGAKIREERRNFIEIIQPYFKKNHEYLSSKSAVAVLSYPGSAESLQQQEEYLSAELACSLPKEKRVRLTCVGPHRDDPLFMLGGEEVRHYVSQGEWRTIILSYKIALMQLLNKSLGIVPVLLFDDMSAELDAKRQEKLFSLLTESRAQVFVTTTDVRPFQNFTPAAIHRFSIKDGEISPDGFIQ